VHVVGPHDVLAYPGGSGRTSALATVGTSPGGFTVDASETCALVVGAAVAMSGAGARYVLRAHLALSYSLLVPNHLVVLVLDKRGRRCGSTSWLSRGQTGGPATRLPTWPRRGLTGRNARWLHTGLGRRQTSGLTRGRRGRRVTNSCASERVFVRIASNTCRRTSEGVVRLRTDFFRNCPAIGVSVGAIHCPVPPLHLYALCCVCRSLIVTRCAILTRSGAGRSSKLARGTCTLEGSPIRYSSSI
jgi:hypothetical protein